MEDVHKVLDRLFIEKALIGLVVKELLHREMLAECVVREEDVVPGHVRRHGIGPMEHPHFDENEFFTPSEFKCITRLDNVEVPAPFAVLALETLNRVGGAVDRRFGNFGHQRRQGARMVAFAVVRDDAVDFTEVDFPLQILDKIETVRGPDRIDKDGFLFLDQIGVLTRTVHDRVVVAMETFEFPIDIPDPAHISLNVLSHEENPLR